MSGSSDKDYAASGAGDTPNQPNAPNSQPPESQQGNVRSSGESAWSDRNWADPTTRDSDVNADLSESSDASDLSASVSEGADGAALVALKPRTVPPPLSLVETAFLSSAAGLIWLVSYYLSLSPWMRILFPTPIALVYLRWGGRAAWMAALVTSLLLSVLMGPYLSLLFFIPYGLLGVQLGAMWKRDASWGLSISVGTIISTFSFFFRVWLLSIFLGEDIWVYLTNRIADFVDWIIAILVGWGILGIGAFGRPDVTLVQLLTLGAVILSDIVYLFTVHLGAWVLLNRLGNPIPDPPEWVQVLLEEES
jgi:uncharacterized protein YybS (DUF2232 family)